MVSPTAKSCCSTTSSKKPGGHRLSDWTGPVNSSRATPEVETRRVERVTDPGHCKGPCPRGSISAVSRLAFSIMAFSIIATSSGRFPLVEGYCMSEPSCVVARIAVGEIVDRNPRIVLKSSPDSFFTVFFGFCAKSPVTWICPWFTSSWISSSAAATVLI